MPRFLPTSTHNCHSTFQSVHRAGYYTETALLKVANVFFHSSNKGNLSILASNDFYTAFDTIDHSILAQHLRTDIEFAGTVPKWFSTLSNCSHFAPVNTCVSYGLHFIKHHPFYDDLQLQMFALPDKIYKLFHSVQSCIDDTIVWTSGDMLKPNENTELMLVT